MIKKSLATLLLILLICVGHHVSCFSSNHFSGTERLSINDINESKTMLYSACNEEGVLQYWLGDRSSFLRNAILSSMCTVGLTAKIESAIAADDSLKGTKKDPAFEACLGKCMYECTKPKGVEQKTRAVCLPECKQACATTKAQLFKGLPLSK